MGAFVIFGTVKLEAGSHEEALEILGRQLVRVAEGQEHIADSEDIIEVNDEHLLGEPDAG